MLSREILATVGVVSIIVVAQVSGETDISLGLECEVGEILLGEPFLCTVKIENRGKGSVKFPITWFDGRFELEMEGPSGKRRWNPFSAPADGPDSVRDLQAGSGYAVRFGAQEGGRLMMPGRYAIAAVLTSDGSYRGIEVIDGKTVQHSCWKGRVASGSLNIEVKAPTLEADIGAQAILGATQKKEHFYLAFSFISMNIVGRENTEYHQVVRLFPKSKYAPHCIYRLGEAYARRFLECGSKDYFDVARSYFEQLFREHKDFHFTDDAYVLLARCLAAKEGKKGEARKVLLELLKNYPKSDCLVDARELLVGL
jgi:TolA-binding protein